MSWYSRGSGVQGGFDVMNVDDDERRRRLHRNPGSALVPSGSGQVLNIPPRAGAIRSAAAPSAGGDSTTAGWRASHVCGRRYGAGGGSATTEHPAGASGAGDSRELSTSMMNALKRSTTKSRRSTLVQTTVGTLRNLSRSQRLGCRTSRRKAGMPAFPRNRFNAD